MTTPAGCTLTPAGFATQRERIAAIRPAVRQVERAPGEVRIHVDDQVDGRAVADWLATERGCCSFLTIEYGDGMLRIASDDPERDDVLDGFAAVFGGTAR